MTQTAPKPSREWQGHWAMAIQTLLMGPGYVFANRASVAIEPAPLFGMRMAGNLLLFGVLFYAKGGFGDQKPSRSEWKDILLLAVLGIFLNQFLFTLGLRYTSPSSSALIYALTPLVVLLLSVGVAKNERLTWPKMVAVLIAFSGVAVVILQRTPPSSVASNPLLGNLITVVGMLAWGGYLFFSRLRIGNRDPMQITALVMMSAAIIYLPLGIWTWIGVPWRSIGNEAWFGVGYMIVINSLLSYVFITYAMMRMPAYKVAIYINLQPITATLFSVIFLGELLSTPLLVGGGLTLLGVLLLNLSRMPSPQDPNDNHTPGPTVQQRKRLSFVLGPRRAARKRKAAMRRAVSDADSAALEPLGPPVF